MTPSSNPKARFRAAWVVRLAVSVLVLAAIFSFLPLREVLTTILAMAPRDWLTTLVVFLIGHVVSATKWQLLADSGAGFSAVLRAHFGGLVANLCLPGVAGGDVVRAGLLYRHVSNTTRLALGSLADRLIDTIGLLLIAGVGLLLVLSQFASGTSLLLGVGIALAVIALGPLIAVRIYPIVVRRLPEESRLRRIVERLGAGAVALSRQPLRLVLCLALSMSVQIAFIVLNIRLAEAAGVDVPIAAWFFAWPLSKIIATLPVSVGGIGVREASLAGFLMPFGASPASVVATGLIWQSILIAGGILGGLVVLLSDRVLAHRPSVGTGGR